MGSDSIWFEEKVHYQGELRAEFENGISLEGSTTVFFDQYGMAVVRIQRGGILPQQRCTRIIINTDIGIVKSVEASNIYVQPVGNLIEFRLLQLQFDSKSQQNAKYWVLPLLNYTGKFRPPFPTRFEHPLRLTSPSLLPINDETESEVIRMLLRDQLTTFSYNGNCSFIEALPDYDERLKRLENNQSKTEVTAIMVGEVGANSIEADDVKTWFPIDYLLLLSLSTGVEVGGVWIEFRSQDGDLVRRVHTAFGQPVYTAGEGMIDDWMNVDATSRLLSDAAQCLEFGQTFLRVTLRHLVKANRYTTSLDDRFAHLIRAIDGLIKHYQIGVTDLLARLDTTQKTQVRSVINKAGGELRAYASTIGSTGTSLQENAIRRIAEQVQSGCYTVEDKFGEAFSKLLDKFGLYDYSIVDSYFTNQPLANNRDSFSKVLSYLRGDTIHAGYFDFQAISIEKVEAMFNHLFDVVIRIIFKILDYNWVYQTRIGGTNFPVDWVQLTTPASHLGYI